MGRSYIGEDESEVWSKEGMELKIIRERAGGLGFASGWEGEECEGNDVKWGANFCF